MAAGDKRGKVGFFFPDRQDDSCVTVMDCHTGATTRILFDPMDSQKVFTSSYENIIRMMDLQSQKLVQILDAGEEDGTHSFMSCISLDHINRVMYGGEFLAK